MLKFVNSAKYLKASMNGGKFILKSVITIFQT